MVLFVYLSYLYIKYVVINGTGKDLLVQGALIEKRNCSVKKLNFKCVRES